MKLYTLGTSCGSALKNRSCSVNVIEEGGNFYIFDCGGNVEEKFVDMDLEFSNIKAVFISHMHRDHVQSLPAILHRTEYEARHKGNKDNKPDIFMPEEKGISGFKTWLECMYMNRASEFAKFTVVNEGIIYKDDFITVTAIPTKHIDSGLYPSFSYMVEAKGKRFIYTGDLSETFCDYPEIIFKENFDCVLCELAHFNMENNYDEIIKSRTKKMIFTHTDLLNIPLIEDSKGKFPFEVEIACDRKCYEI